MKKFIKSSYFAIIMLFLYVPIVIMIIFSFNSGNTVFEFLGFSGNWYNQFFADSPFIKSIVTSLFVAVVSTVISLIIGTMAAIGLSRSKKVTQKSWFGIANIPLINADVVTAVSLMLVFLLSGMKFGIGTLLLAHISFNVPYVLITVMPRLRKVDPAMIEAASDLGAKPYQILFKVILPVLKPAIITAAAIAFAMSFDDFIISYFTGGPETNVSTFIYTAKRIKPFVYAFGTLLVAVIVFAVICWNAASAIKTKRKETRIEIEKGWYKAKKINKLNHKLTEQYLLLNEHKKMVVSKRIDLWIRYLYLRILIRLYSIRNFDKKISRLEWRQYKIKNEIRNEKRFEERLKKTVKAISKLEKELTKKSIDVKKSAKIHLRLDKLEDKKDYLESEIEWMNNRDDKAANKAAKLSRKIKSLKKEYKNNFVDLSKKDIVWYKKKIKYLEEWKLEVEEGKNHYKLRMTTEKLKDLREIRNNKLFALNEKLEVVKSKIYVWKDLGYKYDKDISKKGLQNSVLSANDLEAKQDLIAKVHHQAEWKIIKTENRIQKLYEIVSNKKDKLFPNDEDGSNAKSRNWLTRSWKVIAVVLVGLAAFSGLTVAYVKNNVYDLMVGNWGEYIDPDLINKFQDETGYKVNYQVYDSNETLYNKLYTFDYDVMVPSDYMVQKLAIQDKLQKIDWSKLTDVVKPDMTVDGDKNVKQDNEPSTNDTKNKIPDALVKLMNKSTIPDKDTGPQSILNYALPYFWGDLVLVFNTNNQSVRDFLQTKGIEVDTNETLSDGSSNPNYMQISNPQDLSWDIVREAKEYNNKFQISLQNDPKNLFMVGDEVAYGQENFKNTKQVDNVKPYISNLISGNNVKLQGDDMLSSVVTGNFDIAMMYAGDLLSSTTEHESAGGQPYAYGRPAYSGTPKWKASDSPDEVYERTNVYSDNMVIGKNASGKHLEAAYAFMNFMFKYENAKDNSQYIGLASPNEEVMDDLANEDNKEFANLYEPIIVSDPNYQNNTGNNTNIQLSFMFNDDVDRETVNAYNDLTARKN